MPSARDTDARRADRGSRSSRGSTGTTGSSARRARSAKERFEAADWAAVAAAGQGADPLLRRARARDGRAAAGRVRRRLRSTPPSGRRRSSSSSRCSSTTSGPSSRRRSSTRSTTRVLGRTYFDNDLIFVARGDLDRVHRVRPADLPDATTRPTLGLARRALPGSSRDFGWRRPFADLERDVEQRRRARSPSTSAAAAARSRTSSCTCSARPSTATRPRTWSAKIVNGNERDAVRRPGAARRRGRLALDTVLLDQEASRSSSRSRARTSWSTWTCRRATSSSCRRSCRRSRARSSTPRSGSAKQGKTLFVRDLRHHLHHSRGPRSSRRPARAAR